MALDDLTHKASCDAATGRGAYGTVFTDTSGTTGDNEGSGVTRALITWPTGSMVGGYWVKTAAPVDIAVPSGVYKEAGVMSAASDGNFVGAQPFVSGDVSVSGEGGVITTTFVWEGMTVAVYAQFDHVIVGFNPDMMSLNDANTMGQIVSAIRADGVWTIHAEGEDDVTVTPNGVDRGDVMTAMETQALAKLGPKDLAGHGYITCRPRELSTMP